MEASLCGFTSDYKCFLYFYPLKDKLSFLGEKGVSSLLGSVRISNDSAAIAGLRVGVQGAYFALRWCLRSSMPAGFLCAEHQGEKAVARYVMVAQLWTIPTMSFSSFIFPLTTRSKATTRSGKPISSQFSKDSTTYTMEGMSSLQWPTTVTCYTAHLTSCQLLRYCITNINWLAFQSVTVHRHPFCFTQHSFFFYLII